ncbi:MAG: DUF4391 domain-containing protein [Muribaculaceae bacterium]|nr:DUF4391 domain-containing protein [Muribaculaceae bacterium]
MDFHADGEGTSIGEIKLAVFHAKLFITGWQPLDRDFTLLSSNYSLDKVWENIVAKIGNFKIEEQNTLTEQIVNNEERDKFERKIRILESKISSTRQPRRKRELYLELHKHKTHHDTKRN